LLTTHFHQDIECNAVLVAAKFGHLDLMKWLVLVGKEFGHFSLTDKSASHWSVPHYAAASSNSEMMKYALDKYVLDIFYDSRKLKLSPFEVAAILTWAVKSMAQRH